jgi:hypothetical protein
METLLIVAVVLIALAIIVQAGMLVFMYIMGRRLTNNVNGLLADSRRLMAPVENIANNLRVTSDDLVESGKIVRQQAHHIEAVVNETRERILTEINVLRGRVVDTVDDARVTVMEPVREWSAIASAIGVGIRTFFRPRVVMVESIEDAPIAENQQNPAA